MGHDFKNYNSQFIGISLLSILFTILGLVVAANSKTVLSLVFSIVLIIHSSATLLIGYAIYMLKDTCYKKVSLIGSEYLYSCDINIMSRIMTNISKMAGIDAMESFSEKEYIDNEHYICYGDRDIERFISAISKGISNRHYIMVKCIGYDRQIAIDFCDINKKMCIYLTNLSDKQIISFRPLRKAQRLGLKRLETGDSEEYRVNFINPLNKYERNTAILIGFMTLMVIFLAYHPVWILSGWHWVAIILIWLIIYRYNKRKINKLTKFSDAFINKVNNSNSKKQELKHKIVQNIIESYHLDDYKDYIEDVFNANGFIYADNKVFCTNDAEYESLIKAGLQGIDGKYHIDKIYGHDGRRSAGITFDNSDIALVMSIVKLDDGQIVVIE